MEKGNIKHIIKGVTADKNIIPSIFNYCDRWCERCTHTNYCSVFKIEQEMNNSNEELDEHNKQFWNSLSGIFNATRELMIERMQELKLKPEMLIPADDFITKSISNDMVVISRKYALDVAKWLDKYRVDILTKFNILENTGNDNALHFSETIDVIQHYFMLIATKTYRASLVLNDDDDAKGSAKVTLIVIGRSIEAWSTLLYQLPELEDDILQFLKTLSQIKRLLLLAFPSAMDFKRPGFDE